jgi:competence ComEA-like helix-hairpin-helix protein
LAESPRSAADALSRAALFVSALLVLLAIPFRSDREAPLCEAPREVRAEVGWTREVRCGKPEQGATALRGPAKLLFGQKLDLNRAGVRELEVLPGIGPGRAAAIVRTRCDAPFETLEDLQQIRGIGPVTTSGLRSWAEVTKGASAVNAQRSSVACGDAEAPRENDATGGDDVRSETAPPGGRVLGRSR